MSSDPPFIRELGLIEAFCREKTILDLFRSHSISVRFNRAVSTPLIFRVLREIILEHPSLACHVAHMSSNNQPGFSLMKQLMFKDLVKFDPHKTTDAKTCKDVTDNYLFDPTDETKPLFLIIVLEGQKELIIVAEHTLLDGVANPIFWQMFHQKLDDFDKTGTVESELEPIDYETAVLFDYEKDKELISSLYIAKAEDLYPLLPRWSFTISKWLKSILPKFTHKYIPTYEMGHPIEGYSVWEGDQSEKNRPDTDHFVLNFTPEEVKKMLQVCKEQGVTITAFLNYCFYYAVFHGNHALNFDKTVHSLSSSYIIGGRRYLTEEQKRKYDTDFGDHFFLGFMNYMTEDHLKEFSWDVIKKMNAEMNSRVKDPYYVQNVGLSLESAKQQHTLTKALKASISKPRTELFNMSNLGLITFPESNWVVEDMVFFQDPAHINCCTILSVISTKNGGMNFTSCYVNEGALQNIGKLPDLLKKVVLENV